MATASATTYKVRLSPTVINTLSMDGDHFWGAGYEDDPTRFAEWRQYLAVEFPSLASIFEDIVSRAGVYPRTPVVVNADQKALESLAIHGTWMESCGSEQPGWSRAGRGLCDQLAKIAADHEELADYRTWLIRERTPSRY